VLPLLFLTTGWGVSMTLFFSVFEAISLALSVFIVCYIIQDGESNYLEGMLLIATYFIIGVAMLKI
jgi:Ca2+:H+ antiporter